MKNTTSKEISTKRTKIDKKKYERYGKKLKPLYIEYELSQLIKTSNDKKDHLINIISKTEYKYVCYLKKQYEQ